jgi:methionyl-tRNA synthetase
MDAYLAEPEVEQIHFIGKDIVTFHTLFWPATLHFSGRKAPDRVYVHGHLTVSGEKMSKSRGTGISPLRYLELGMNAEWLRYYIAAKLNARVEDLDFNPDDFVARVNADLVGKYINIASRAAGFLAKRFGGRLSGRRGRGRPHRAGRAARACRHHRHAVRGARIRQGAARGDAAGRPRQRIRRPHKPWDSPSSRQDAALHDVCTSASRPSACSRCT